MPLVGLRNSSAREASARASVCVLIARHVASEKSTAQARHTGAEADGEQVHVDGRPGKRGDGELLGLVVGELPERQQSALLAAVLVARVLEVLEVCTPSTLLGMHEYNIRAKRLCTGVVAHPVRSRRTCSGSPCAQRSSLPARSCSCRPTAYGYEWVSHILFMKACWVLRLRRRHATQRTWYSEFTARFFFSSSFLAATFFSFVFSCCTACTASIVIVHYSVLANSNSRLASARTLRSKSSRYASYISHCDTLPEMVTRGGGSVTVPRSCRWHWHWYRTWALVQHWNTRQRAYTQRVVVRLRGALREVELVAQHFLAGRTRRLALLSLLRAHARSSTVRGLAPSLLIGWTSIWVNN